jgi:Holliday junction resolvase
MTPEGKVKDKVKKILKEMGAYYVMPATGGYGSSGAPDFLICYSGMFYGVECKANGNEPTALQTKHLASIRDAGGRAIVINEDNIGELKDFLLDKIL